MRKHAERILRKTVLLLVQQRKEKKISHEDLAKKASISRTAISFIESGKRSPSLLLCLLIASALGVNLSDIIKSAEEQTKEGEASDK